MHFSGNVLSVRYNSTHPTPAFLCKVYFNVNVLTLRYNSTHPTPAMTAEGAHEALKQKCHRQWKDLAQVRRAAQAQCA